MIQLLAFVVCGYLGWQRAAFMRWPLALIVFAVLAGCGLVFAYHQGGAGPDLDGKLLRAAVSLIAFPLLAYWLAWAIRGALDRRRAD